MKKKITKCILGIFAAVGAALAGVAGYQKFCLKQAQKRKDETHLQEIYTSQWGDVAYRSEGKGRPLMLLHSMMLGASSREWDAVLDALAEQYHVYALDLPGFGNSFSPEKPWTAYQYALLLQAFIKDVIKRPVCICGANGGADLALTLSKISGEDIRRMVLISPEGIGRGFASDEDTRSLPLLLAPVAGTQTFLTGTSKARLKAQLEDAFYAKEKISDELVQQYTNAARYGTHAQATFAGLQTRFWAADSKPAFAALIQPFMMIWGEENKLNPIEHFHTAEKMKQHGSFVLFEKTGALPHMENSQEFLDNIKAFLK